ncbi:MAG: hypothetical protein A2096_09110 [Spirochaetes bacterium GWF1_41_5]|nr:MAG: hypothetical protein A2096_09110 [Spirochaetes bacterium GWF1_41_5]
MKENFFLKNKINIIIILSYAVSTGFILCFHEPWGDEAEAWLIARDLDFFSMIFRQIRYCGTPFIWYTCIFPFAKLSFPYFTMSVLHWLMSVAAGSLLLFRSPFPLFLKILLLFSYYFAFEFAVVARCYTPGILLLFFIAVFYKTRFSNPIRFGILTGLLGNTNSLCAVLAAGIGLVYFIELAVYKKFSIRTFSAFIIMLISGIFVIVQLYPPDDLSNSAGIFRHFNYKYFYYAVKNAFFPAPYFCGAAVNIFALLLLTAGMAALSFSLETLLLALFSVICYAGLFVFIYPGSHRQHAFFLIMLIFLFWIERVYREKTIFSLQNLWIRRWPQLSADIMKKIFFTALAASLLLSVFHTAYTWQLEYQFPFSAGKETARFLKTLNIADTPGVGHPSWNAQAVLPWLPGLKLYYPDNEKISTFKTPDAVMIKNINMSNEDAITAADNFFSGNTNILLILRDPLPEKFKNDFTLLFRSRDDAFGICSEKYNIYFRKKPGAKIH